MYGVRTGNAAWRKRNENKPVETLTLPKDIVAAARTYAAREKKSVDELFMEWLKQSFGFQGVYVVDEGSRQVRRRRSIPQDLVDITGVISLPEDKCDKELIREAILDKYESIR